MQTLGLIGGVGSGKSTVTDLFCRLGAAKIDADVLGHQVLLTQTVKSVALERWGPGVLDAGGGLDRRRLAAIVFEASKRGRRDLDFLKSLTHPLIVIEVKKKFLEWEQEGRAVVIFDAPLLLEAQWDRMVDRIVFVEASRALRLARVLKRGWTEAEFDAREAAQMSVDVKRKRADWIIQNEGNLERTLDQIEKIWQNLS